MDMDMDMEDMEDMVRKTMQIFSSVFLIKSFSGGYYG